MLQIRDLQIILREEHRILLKDFNFTLNPGDKVGLIGEEGNGKSILLKTIVDRDRVETYCEVTGEVSLGQEILGYLPQSLDDEDLDMTPEAYMDRALSGYFLDYNAFYRYIRDFHFDESLISDQLTLRALSGGERTKFLLLVELLKEPSVFLFDEPSNDLDYQSLLWLEQLMQTLDIPFIFVSHDTRLLTQVANRIIHLEQIDHRSEAKHTIFKGSYEEYVTRRGRFIAAETKRAQKEEEEFAKKAARYRKVHDAVERALRGTSNDAEGKNLKDKMHTVKAIGRRLEKEEENLTPEPDYEEAIDVYFDEDIDLPNGKVILDAHLDQLVVGDRVLAENIQLKLVGPEKVCIVGKNGAGKTTLLRYFMQELADLNVRVGYMPQAYFETGAEPVTALDYLAKEGTKEEHTRISTFLGGLNFKREEMYRKISDLSGGQKAKLFFAKMNLDRAEVLVLDEPTRNLSPLSQPEIIEALIQYKGAIIAVSHDRDFIDQVFDAVYELDPQGLHRVR